MLDQLETTEAHRDGHLPGNIDMWVFVLGDLVIFGFYVLVFMIYRHHEPTLFRASQEHLNLLVGTVNTLVLLTSSRFVAQAVQAARARDNERARRLIALAMACAAVFTALKAFEWTEEVHHGFTFPHNDFFMFYFALTGVHLFHVLLGVVVLGVVSYNLRDPEQGSSLVEAAATYWHMVDVVWVVLFATVYLLR